MTKNSSICRYQFMTITQRLPRSHGETSLIGIMYVYDIFTMLSHISNFIPCQWLECEPILRSRAQGRIEKIVKCKLQFTLEKYFHIYIVIIFMGKNMLQDSYTVTVITANKTIFILLIDSHVAVFIIGIEQWQIAIAICLAIGKVKCI
ncbi:hypothetical protein G113_10744 [Aeromonas molluscorum 848]|uniref:Uncharacterized protein n=1 Tax=Aeromonas molluscorum 848 TaxID=1268236 RepID=R1GTY7_9GAMM|nr:hypothetical protein G113_10744 [Aeromonas molluscorum 848]